VKTMAEVITSHATHGLRDGKHVCHAPGCLWVYGRHGYPSPATVAEHVADALSAAGFGPVREAQARALRDAADGWQAYIRAMDWGTTAPIAWLRARAATITESTTE